jgi:hypothetical protein
MRRTRVNRQIAQRDGGLEGYGANGPVDRFDAYGFLRGATRVTRPRKTSKTGTRISIDAERVSAPPTPFAISVGHSTGTPIWTTQRPR